MRVLIIESDDSFASTLREALEARGVDVAITADGKDGVSLAQSRETSAVVLSVELGDRLTGGFAWCNKFKRDPSLRSIPLLLTSSLATEDTFEQHRKLKTRADGYLLKPYGPRELLDWLEPYLPRPPQVEETGPVDLARELLDGWDDSPAETAPAEITPIENAAVGISDEEVDLLDTDGLLADIFDELGDATPASPAGLPLEETPGPVADEAPLSALRDDPEDLLDETLPWETEDGDEPWDAQVAAEPDHDEEIGSASAAGDLDLDEESDPSALRDDPFPSAPSLEDPPWSDATPTPSTGSDERVAALELQLASLRADVALLPELRERAEHLERENAKLGMELAAARGETSAHEEKSGELEAEISSLTSRSAAQNERIGELESELDAARERASLAERKLEEWAKRREELSASLAAMEALLADAPHA